MGSTSAPRSSGSLAAPGFWGPPGDSIGSCHPDHLLQCRCDGGTGPRRGGHCPGSRAVRSGTAISSSLEMEALLYASGSRAVHHRGAVRDSRGEEPCLRLSLSAGYPAFRDLSAIMEFVDEDWEAISDQKRERLMEAFSITPGELEAAGPGRSGPRPRTGCAPRSLPLIRGCVREDVADLGEDEIPGSQGRRRNRTGEGEDGFSLGDPCHGPGKDSRGPDLLGMIST